MTEETALKLFAFIKAYNTVMTACDDNDIDVPDFDEAKGEEK